MATTDPRLSPEECYGTQDANVTADRKDADELVRDGFMLPEDAGAGEEKAQKNDVLN